MTELAAILDLDGELRSLQLDNTLDKIHAVVHSTDIGISKGILL